LAAAADFDVDPDYFKTIGLRMVSGRLWLAGDSADLVVVDQAFAERFWPNGDAVGAKFSLGGERSPGKTVSEVIGVASHVQLEAAGVPLGGDLFAIYRRIASDAAPLNFVTRLTSSEALRDVAATVRSMTSGVTVRAGLMDDRYAEVFGDTRIAAGVTGGFAVIALLIATLGLSGVVASLVAGRTREIGIRLALGAARRDVYRMVLGSTLRSVIAGTVAGIVAAFASSRWIEHQLHGVATADPTTYAVVGAAISVSALAATWRPARRAAAVDPAVTLRAE
jgi:predicted lysophospholipase L1 biosynthesis ABC-type transport system permease subunit